MPKARFDIEISCSHRDWYRYPLEFVFTPGCAPGDERRVVRYAHPDLDRRMRFTTDGPRGWVLFGVRLSEPPPTGSEPLWIDVTVYCDGRPVRRLRHTAAELYRTVSGAHIYYAARCRSDQPEGAGLNY